MQVKTGHCVYIQTAFLGDLLLALPALRQIRASGFERITLLCREGLGSFVKELGVVDDYVEVRKGSQKSYDEARRALSQTRVDQVVCPHESFRSMLLTWRLRADRKVGFTSALGQWIFHETATRRSDLPEALRQLALVVPQERLEDLLRLSPRQQTVNWITRSPVIPVGTDLLVPELFRAQERRRWIRRNQPLSPLKIAVAPGSQWPTKRWQPEGFASAVVALAESRSVEVELHGASNERGLCEEVVAALQAQGVGASLCAGQLTLMEVARAYADSDLLVCNDSGAQHMGALSGVATVSVFGPTHPRQGYQAWSGQSVVVGHPGLDCRPCGAHGALECPLGHHRCMKEVSGERVAHAAADLLRALEPNESQSV